MTPVHITRSVPRWNEGPRVREVTVGEGLPPVEELVAELNGYVDVLLGRAPAPIDAGVMTLMEVADAYFARACEIDMMIHAVEREEGVFKGAPHYKFRTGELRAFLDLSKRAAELGSRRLTNEQLLVQMKRDAGY